MIKVMNVEVTYKLFMKVDFGNTFNHELPYRYIETFDTREEAEMTIHKAYECNLAFKDVLKFTIEPVYNVIKDGE